MALLRFQLSGAAHRFHSDVTSGVVDKIGVLGVDISARTVGDTNYTVVQILLDDERPDGDLSLLSCPLVAEITRPPGPAQSESDELKESDVVASALFDHDQFRRKLKSEVDAKESVTKGVLLMDQGQLPEPWVRLAFVEIPLRITAGLELRIYRSTVEELLSGVESAYGVGRISDSERSALITSIEQHHPQDDI